MGLEVINLFGLLKPKKLCKHDWEYIDKEQKIGNAGGLIDIYYLKTYQCKYCLKVKKTID